MKEYKIQMFKNGKWGIASYPFGAHYTSAYSTLEKAEAMIEECRKGWRECKANPAAWETVLRCRPIWTPDDVEAIKFRVLSREVSEWEPIK